MKEVVGQILRYIKRFGVVQGLEVYRKLQNSKGVISLKLNDYREIIHLRSNSSDPMVFYQVCVMNEYDFDYGLTPAFIVDAGANIGLTAAYFANHYPQAKIVSIEPEKENFAMLLSNTKGYKNIVPIRAGLWNESKKLSVANTKSASWAFTLEESGDTATESFDAVTLDSILDQFNQSYIDILKIDIEGAEIELFTGNYHTWLSRTKIIVIELHDRMRRGCSKAFFKALIDYTFRVELKGENLICFNESIK